MFLEMVLEQRDFKDVNERSTFWDKQIYCIEMYTDALCIQLVFVLIILSDYKTY